MKPRSVRKLVKAAIVNWFEDDAFKHAAAISYYALFSLAPLLLIVLALVGAVWGADKTRTEVVAQFEDLMGKDGAQLVATLIEQSDQSAEGTLATILGIGIIVVGASGTFAQLRAALNTIWDVVPPPGQGVWNFLRTRLLSLAMVLGVAFLLLLSLVVSALLAALGKWTQERMPLPAPLLEALNTVVSFAVIAILFGAIFKWLPDAKVHWREVWIGALLTSGLFTLGKFVIGLYLGRSGIASPYGAAGSVIIVLVWVYYSTLIFLLGAEFTQSHSHWLGRDIVPARGAIRRDQCEPKPPKGKGEPGPTAAKEGDPEEKREAAEAKAEERRDKAEEARG